MNTAKSCLLIDDDSDDQEIFLNALTEISSDAFCVAAKGADTAMRILKEARYSPDYIFLDLNMPQMNGIDFLRTIKKDPEFRSIPVIIYSTSSQPKEVAHTLSLGATAFFTKSVHHHEICTMLRAFF
jgi:CheY-like chemotaxis protein